MSSDPLKVLEEACSLAARFYPPAERVLSSCTLVGLPFSLSTGSDELPHAYFYQVALWLEHGGQLYLPGAGMACLEHASCSYAPLVLVREACLERETPLLVAASLLHEVLHLERYPIYTRKVLKLVREQGLTREEAVARVVPEEEREVEALLAGLAARHRELREAMLDADLVERSICLEDALRGRLVPWGTFRHVMNFYVFLNRSAFRVHTCFRELRELLLLDARAKEELYRALSEEERERQAEQVKGLLETARELEVSWVFRWSPRRQANR